MASTHDTVRERYRRTALRMATQERCQCATRCGHDEYGVEDLAQLGLDTSISIGSGNPLLHAGLHAGDVVLDLGSGGGLDVLLAARQVAPGGHAYGIDLTDEMVELANGNRQRAGVENATFLKGAIERVPLPEGTVDVVISNGTINLADDKGAVIREALRLLRPGGRLAVSDLVQLRTPPEGAEHTLEAAAGVLARPLLVEDYRRLLLEAGFQSIELEITDEQSVDGMALLANASIRARKPG